MDNLGVPSYISYPIYFQYISNITIPRALEFFFQRKTLRPATQLVLLREVGKLGKFGFDLETAVDRNWLSTCGRRMHMMSHDCVLCM